MNRAQQHVAGIVVLAIAMALLLSSCQTTAKKPVLTPLEIQAMQVRDFESTKTEAFNATLSVFQDLGYIVSSADKETGFITAMSPTQSRTDWILTGNTYNSQVKATAFVEELRPGLTRVRLNFVDAKQTSSVYGQSRTADKPILDPTLYSNAFERIQTALFVRQANK